ncbi:MAG TPA: TetR/AcrR family transcriptional regulator [bacterium]|jgi:AcrR family transcriptional regulator
MPGKPREERIADAVSAAEDLFLERGYDTVTLKDIAKRAGFSPAAMYYYFPSKEGILAAVCVRLYEPIELFMAVADEKDDPLEALHSFLTDYFLFCAKHPQVIGLFLRDRVYALQDRPRQARLFAGQARLFKWIYGLLSVAEDEGLLARHHKAAKAMTLLYAIEGMVPFMSLSKPWRVKKEVARLEKALLQA